MARRRKDDVKRRRRFLRKYNIFPYDYFIINVENYILEIIVAGGTLPA